MEVFFLEQPFSWCGLCFCIAIYFVCPFPFQNLCFFKIFLKVSRNIFKIFWHLHQNFTNFLVCKESLHFFQNFFTIFQVKSKIFRGRPKFSSTFVWSFFKIFLILKFTSATYMQNMPIFLTCFMFLLRPTRLPFCWFMRCEREGVPYHRACAVWASVRLSLAKRISHKKITDTRSKGGHEICFYCCSCNRNFFFIFQNIFIILEKFLWTYLFNTLTLIKRDLKLNWNVVTIFQKFLTT